MKDKSVSIAKEAVVFSNGPLNPLTENNSVIEKDKAAIDKIIIASEKLSKKANAQKKIKQKDEAQKAPEENVAAAAEKKPAKKNAAVKATAKKTAKPKLKSNVDAEEISEENAVTAAFVGDLADDKKIKAVVADKKIPKKSSSKKVARQATKPAVHAEKVSDENTITATLADDIADRRIEKAVELAKKSFTVTPAPTSIKATLNLRFHTTAGQNLFITANHPLFGNNNVDDALPMVYVDNNNWKVELNFLQANLPSEKIIYNYVLKNTDGSVSYDWGNDKVLDFKNSNTETLIIDSWNHAGYFENVFYTEPFKNVLLKHDASFAQNNIPKTITHIFKVKAPLLGKDEVVCMVGADETLGEWIGANALLMGKAANDIHFAAKLDLSKAVFPFVYKYGVYNTKTKEFKSLENTGDRYLNKNGAPIKQTIVNDGFAVFPNNTWKGAGVAIPVFSLRSENSFGVGEFKDLKLFADWAKSVGLKLIQILPINDTTATHTWLDSYPYAAISAFALHPMFLHLDDVVHAENKHFLDEIKDEGKKLNALDKVDYEKVNELKWNFIKQIFPSQKEITFASKEYKDFFEQNKHWLVPYAAFCFLRDKNNTSDFNYWRANKVYEKKQVENILKENDDAVSMHYFVQYHLHLQLKDATNYAHENNIVIKGDIPIGIYRYGVDAWQQPELFQMDEQAGAPPDDFAVKGQNWGFPTYNWSKMREDGFAWWQKRFAQMSHYFDAFRIDHILGFFRIWSIPFSETQGIMGHFDPAIPVHINEFHERNIWFDYARYCKPYITEDVLYKLFGDRVEEVKKTFLYFTYYNQYEVKPEFNTQRKLESYFENLRDENQKDLKGGMLDLLSNVILFKAENTNGQYFHFRFGMETTTSFQSLEYGTQQQLRELYVNYFFRRQDDFWQKEAMQKLPDLKRGTNMLVCGEDLGMVPSCVPEVMKDLGILSLEIQRMPKDNSKEFFHPNDAPYLSVVTPATHDMSTIRAWWEEDRIKTQRFYNNELGQWGDAPYFCEDWVNKLIVLQHLYSPAMWSIFQLQDLLGIDKSIRRLMPHEERINLPSNPKNYWQYRMHLTLEELNASENYNEELKKNVEASGR